MTFSILAFDADAKLVGSAVVSEWPSCGAAVQYFRPDVGMVNIQNMSDAQIAEYTLSELARGGHPDQALAAATAKDITANQRQMTCMNLKGETFGFTGNKCQDTSAIAKDECVIVAGHGLPNEEVAASILEKFNAAEGNLAERLIEAVKHGYELCDSKELKSAALRVYHTSYPQQRFYPVDLRVDIDDNPMTKLDELFAHYNENERRGIGATGF